MDVANLGGFTVVQIYSGITSRAECFKEEI